MEPSKDDIELLRKAKNGDMQAFQSIIEQHQASVAGIVKGILGDNRESDEVGQEVFIRLFESLGKFKEQSSLLTYVIRIAINLSLNESKKRKKKSKLFSQLKEIENRGTEDSSIDLNEMLYLKIHQLEPELQPVAILRMIGGYAIQDTASILNIPPGTVMSRLYRTQKKLKQVVAKKEGYE